MSYAQEQRLRRLEALATPTTRGADIRAFLRSGRMRPVMAAA
jgi:hypothetical protein